MSWERGRWRAVAPLGDGTLGGGSAVAPSLQATSPNRQKSCSRAQWHQKQFMRVPQDICYIFFHPLSLSLLPCSLLVSNRHHFFDSDILYHFWINFRRRRRLTELLNENSSRALSESPDSPFCLRKLNPEPGNTSFLSGNRGCESRDCITRVSPG